LMPDFEVLLIDDASVRDRKSANIDALDTLHPRQLPTPSHECHIKTFEF
jgi:hypothetical protein